MTRRRAVLTVLVCGVFAGGIAYGDGARSYRIDASRSSATIEVGKSGVLSFVAGHTHEVLAPSIAGTIVVDFNDPARSNVRVTIDASALKVSGKGEPAN